MPTHSHTTHHQEHHASSPKASAKSYNWVVVILALIALFNIGFLGLRAIAAYRMKQRYVETQGLVVDITVQRPSDTSVEHHYPVVEFHTSEGKTVVFKAKTGSPEPQYQPGETVTVLYNKEKPYVAVVETEEVN